MVNIKWEPTTSRLSDLEWTQFWVRDDEKHCILKLVVWWPQKVVCIPSLRGRTQSLSSLLNTVTCPSRCPMTCLTLTSRLSDLKRTHYWVRNDEKNMSFEFKIFFRLGRAPIFGLKMTPLNHMHVLRPTPGIDSPRCFSYHSPLRDCLLVH